MQAENAFILGKLFTGHNHTNCNGLGEIADNKEMRFLQLTLENFQVHKHLEVKFGPATTAIQGPSDIGKSSILRALRWVCLNDLSGDEFIRIGAKQTKITLLVRHDKQNHEIVRMKGAGVNEYWLDSKVYRAFGTNVPDDISKLLNLNEINFQGQHDSPYWFSETAGEVSRRLNSVIDLSVIDTALSAVASAVRQASDRKTISEERLTEAKKEYEELEPQRDRIKDFETLEQTYGLVKRYEKGCGELESLIGHINTNRNTYRTAKERFEEGLVVLSLADRAFTLVAKCEDLKSLVGEIRKAEDNITNTKRYADEVEHKFHQRIKGEKCPLCQNQLRLP